MAAPLPPPPPTRRRTGLASWVALAIGLVAVAGAGAFAAVTLLGGDSSEPGQAVASSTVALTTNPSETAVAEPAEPGVTTAESPETDIGDVANVAGEVLWLDSTYDQERILEEFGWPHGFYIVFGEDPIADDFESSDPFPIHRLESWDYLDLGFRVHFRNGEMIGSEDIEAIDGIPVRPRINPLWFGYPMTASEVESFVETPPTGRVDGELEGVGEYRVDSFYGQLFVGYHEEVVVTVEAPWLFEDDGGDGE